MIDNSLIIVLCFLVWVFATHCTSISHPFMEDKLERDYIDDRSERVMRNQENGVRMEVAGWGKALLCSIKFARCIKSIACAAQSHWKQKLPNRSDTHVSCPVVELKNVASCAHFVVPWFSCFVQSFCHICCLFGIMQLRIPKTTWLGRIQLTRAKIFLSPIDTSRND